MAKLYSKERLAQIAEGFRQSLGPEPYHKEHIADLFRQHLGRELTQEETRFLALSSLIDLPDGWEAQSTSDKTKRKAG